MNNVKWAKHSDCLTKTTMDDIIERGSSIVLEVKQHVYEMAVSWDQRGGGGGGGGDIG